MGRERRRRLLGSRLFIFTEEGREDGLGLIVGGLWGGGGGGDCEGGGFPYSLRRGGKMYWG